jgi:hypothetical protein
LAGGLNHRADRILAPTMAFTSVETTLKCQSPIAIHHDSNVAGESRRID